MTTVGRSTLSLRGGVACSGSRRAPAVRMAAAARPTARATTSASANGMGAALAGAHLGKRLSCSVAPAVRPSGRRGGLQVEAAVKRAGKRSVVFQMTLISDEGRTDDVLAACKELVEWVHGDPINDPKNGIIEFDCSQDPFEPNTFHFWERYASNGHMAVFKQDRHKEKVDLWMRETRAMLKSPMRMIMYEYVNGQLGHASVPIGPKGEGGLDDATGASGSAGGASMAQTSHVGNEGADEEVEVESKPRKKFLGVL